MHSPAMIIATAKIQDLISDAESARLAKQARTARRARIAGVMAGFRSLLQGANAAPAALPKLSN